jgi:hypothetical protein
MGRLFCFRTLGHQNGAQYGLSARSWRSKTSEIIDNRQRVIHELIQLQRLAAMESCGDQLRIVRSRDRFTGSAHHRRARCHFPRLLKATRPVRVEALSLPMPARRVPNSTNQSDEKIDKRSNWQKYCPVVYVKHPVNSKRWLLRQLVHRSHAITGTQLSRPASPLKSAVPGQP